MCIACFNPITKRGCVLTSAVRLYFRPHAAALPQKLPQKNICPSGDDRANQSSNENWAGLIAVRRLLILILLAMSFCSCKKAVLKVEFDPRAFDSAPPEVKQLWDEAMAASSRNDPGSAISLLRVLSREKISPEQQKTVYDAIVLNELKLKEDAKRGDPVARKAMEKLGYDSVGTNP